MFNLMKRLFPIHRSITGDGVRQTLNIIKELIPINIIEVPSGTKVFDWEVPEEWCIDNAYVLDSNGTKVIDMAESNLHVVGYSAPFHGKVSLEELKQHVFTLPDNPEWIPYVTSYYNRAWGLCMRHNDLVVLKEGEYDVHISSSFKSGSLTYADLVIKGDSDKEILFSTNICHPSMANNELSGPVILTRLASELLKRKERRYTYRFVFVPETIGAITYISKHIDSLKKNVIAGYTVVCAGDPGNFSYLKSKKEDSLVNRSTQHVLNNSGCEYNLYDFLTRGSDERQYSWPGVDIDVGSLMRTKYFLYPEYHTSADDLTFVTEQALEESFEMYLKCIDVFEKNFTYANTTICEPQLGKRNLYYPSASTRQTVNFVRDPKNILAYSDGQTDIISIADKIGISVHDADIIANKFVECGLLLKRD